LTDILMEVVTKPVLVLLVGIFFGMVFQDIRRDMSSMTVQPAATIKRQVDFYTPAPAPLEAWDRFWNNALTGAFGSALLLAALRLLLKRSLLAFVAFGCLLIMGLVFFLHLTHLNNSLSTVTPVAAQIAQGQQIFYFHSGFLVLLVIAFIALVFDAQRTRQAPQIKAKPQ